MPSGRPKSQVLTILEGKWFPRKNVSVRELFEPLFTVWTPNGDSAYHYEMFTNDQAFRSGVLNAFGGGRGRTIYIAAHGTASGIEGFHDEGISRAKIRHALRSVASGAVKRGLYFGSCQFATWENAEFILASCPRVDWIAGYTTDVDWIDSSVLDLFFLRHLFFPAPGKGRPKPRTPSEHLSHAVATVARDMPQLALRTQFHVYVRRQGRGGAIRDLVKDRLESDGAV